MEQTKSREGATRIRSKNTFLEASNPEQALMDFFARSGTAGSIEDRPQHAVRGHPLLLISQLPRSGGSLLSQLLDGHPQLLVHPWEMTIGYPGKSNWPDLDTREPADRLFARLFDPELGHFAAKGYLKRGKVKQKQKRLDFNYSPLEHYLNFVASVKSCRKSRDVLDAYFDAFFRAWHHALKSIQDAVYVAGFVPRLGVYRPSVAGFFDDYPDGRLISIIRDPADWFASRRAHTKNGAVRYDDVDEEMHLWGRMADNALHYQRLYGDRFLLLSFKELITDREGTMRRICAWGGIDFDLSLLSQTFDGNLISPNTNFDDPPERLAKAVLDRKLRLKEGESERAYALTKSWREQLKRAGWEG